MSATQGVFLVEDEIATRELLREGVDWAAAGFRFLGEAADGELALPRILSLKPDLLITDVQLPFLDGLTLARSVRQALPETRIIVISGYDYFDYVKQAMEIGAQAYLLKPFSAQDALNAVIGVEAKHRASQLRIERRVEDRAEAQVRELSLARFVNGLIDAEGGGELGGEALLQAERLGILRTHYFLQVFYFKQRRVELAQELLECLAAQDFTAYMRSENEVLCLVAEFEEERLEVRAAALDAVAERFAHAAPVAWRSPRFERLRELGAQYRPFAALRRGLSGVEPEKEQGAGARPAKVCSASPQLHLDAERLRRFLSYGDAGQSERYWSEVVDGNREALESLIFRSYFLGTIIADIRAYVAQSGWSAEVSVPSSTEIESVVIAAQTRDAIVAYLSRLTRDVLGVRDRRTEGILSSTESRAMEIIRSEYANPGLNVAYLAERLALSTNYLSALFHQRTEQTLSAYILKTRMAHARELLRDSDLPVTEISARVGYNNANHFSTQFKKSSGESPNEYRHRHRQR